MFLNYSPKALISRSLQSLLLITYDTDILDFLAVPSSKEANFETMLEFIYEMWDSINADGNVDLRLIGYWKRTGKNGGFAEMSTGWCGCSLQ